jgi:hypothetical protein
MCGVCQSGIAEDDNSILFFMSDFDGYWNVQPTSSAMLRISAASSGVTCLEKSTPFNSHANVGCNGMTSKPKEGVLKRGGMSPSIGKGFHKAVGVTVIGFSVCSVVIVVVDIVAARGHTKIHRPVLPTEFRS